MSEEYSSTEVSFFSSLDLDRADMVQLKAAVSRQDWFAAKEAWSDHLEKRLSPSWIWNHRDKDQIMAFLKKHGKGLEGSVSKAEGVLKREFRFQGIPRTLKRDIQWWSEDFEFQWINVLHRHHYWLDLGKAYWETGDERYAQDWVHMLKDWIHSNPVQIHVGPNPRDRKGQPWRKLETGSRTEVWIQAMNFFIHSPAFDADAKYLFTRSLREHALRLVASSQNFRPGNWHQVGVTGLFNLGVMFPEFKEAAQWREMGLKHLRLCMEKSVHPDGAQSELTPGYHSWMTNSFLNVQILGDKNGIDLKDFSHRHEKMFEFLMQVTKPDHRYVPLGDADSRDVASMMSLGALTYNRPDMKYLGSPNLNPQWIWRFSPEKVLNYPALKTEEPTLGTHMLSHARYGVMRTGWKKEDRFLLFDCAPRGGNHCHDDRLQIVLYSGRDLLIDRGKLNYDVPLHHTYFKKSQAHNVVLIDEKDQPLGANPELLSWISSDKLDFASAKVQGKQGVSHQRSVLFVKPDYWLVVDHLSGEGEAALTRLFQFPKVKVSKKANSVMTGFKDGDNLWVSSDSSSTLELREGHLGKGGNKTIPTPVAAYVSKGSFPASFGTVIMPFKEKTELPELQRLETDNSNLVSFQLTWKDGRRDQVVMASNPTKLRLGGDQPNGIVMLERDGEDAVVIEKHFID